MADLLIVDDDRELCALLQRYLEGEQFAVTVTHDGEAALQQMRRHAPDLVLLDVMMPDMDGPTTLLRLRELSALAGVPVVFITAKVQPHEIAQLRELGALDVIVKPFDPMTLADRLVALWKGHQGA